MIQKAVSVKTQPFVYLYPEHADRQVFPIKLAAAALLSNLPWSLKACSRLEAAAKVVPAVSLMICAYMCRALLKTVSRGRAGVPEIDLRMRALRLIRAGFFGFVELMMIPVYF